MTRRTEFIGLNQAAEDFLSVSSATYVPPNPPIIVYDTFHDRFDLRSWTIGLVTWIEKVQYEMQFPKSYMFTQLVRADDNTITQNPWSINTIDAFESRSMFNKPLGIIYIS